MDVPVSSSILHLVWILLYIFDLTCVHSQGDVWFSLNGTTYQNNSCVTLEDIGESEDALLCRTNLTSCCRSSNTSSDAKGNWYFPNGTKVPGSTVDWNIFRSRGQRVVHLSRRRGGVDGVYHCEIPDTMNITQNVYIGVYTGSSGSPNVTDLIFDDQSRTLTCTSTGGPATTVTWRRDGVVITNHKQTKRLVDSVNGTYQMVLTIDPSVDQSDIVGTYSCTVENDRGESSETVVIPASVVEEVTPPASDRTTTTTAPVGSSIQPTKIVGGTVTAGTVPVSSSIQSTNNPPSDGATTTSVIIVVAVVIILVVIVVGVVILVVLFRAKKRKQMLEINKLQHITMENKSIEMKFKQEGIEKEVSSNVDQPPYAEIQTEVSPNVLNKSEEFMNQENTFTTEYSEIELEQGNDKHTLPTKPPRHVTLTEEMQSSHLHQDMDQHPSTTNVAQGANIYTMPDTNSSCSVKMHSVTDEVVYSEPIEPSLFTDAVGSPSDSEYLQPYAPIYTIPSNLPKGEEVPLKVLDSNIQEIHELGMGIFGKVILAETVGLSSKDLRLSESDDDKSKSTLVAVKKLKSDAPIATKDAFEKEVNFMSRLTDRNVIRTLGVCHGDTPFIMMEYMEKGDLNQYLQKFKTLSTTDSEPQGQITTSTLVHIATQIASAMKYLASHNFVHRDLATRNCLVGSNYLVKISDFGMSRSLYDSHYYRIHGRFVLPVRWMAYECFYGKFSQKSDVWAFGVTMWEIFTLAKEQPYNDMSDKQVVEDALKGKNRKTLSRPDMCPLKVYKIMLECWEHNSDQRATFEDLFQLLTSVHQDI